MPKPSSYARIAITLPRRDLAAADRLAHLLDRPRSWVVAEAIRRYSAATTTASQTAPGRDTPAQPGLGAQRLAQLNADLALTPEQRVRAAEETLRTSESIRKRPRAQTLRAFDDYLAYVDFKRQQLD